MSFKHGSTCELWYGAEDLSAYFNDVQLTADVDTSETTTFKKTWKTHIPGTAALKMDTKGLYDPALEDMPAILGADGAFLTVGPAGLAAVGDRARLLSVAETQYAESSPVGGVIGFTCAFLAASQVGFGKVVHILEEEAIDGDGGTTDYVDLGTAAAGAVAHLHVTSVSTADSVVVKLQDAATPTGGGADWADLSPTFIFASKSAPGSERVVYTGTVRRYVRASWDLTISGSPAAIIFGVAVARLP